MIVLSVILGLEIIFVFLLKEYLLNLASMLRCSCSYPLSATRPERDRSFHPLLESL